MRDANANVLVALSADPAALRAARLGLVLRQLRDHGPRSRGRLATELGLPRATASVLVEELQDRGLVRRGAPDRRGVGRPGTTVEVAGHTVCGLGAEINVDHVAAMAVDLNGDVVWEVRRGLDSRRLLPAAVLAEVAALVRATGVEVEAAGATAVGLTVGVAGLVDPVREEVVLGPNLGWRDVPVGALLRDLLGDDLPGGRCGAGLQLANEADLAAIAELEPADPDRSDMVVLYGEVGLGGGLVADGRLLTGRHGRAGELGHLVVDPQGRRCGCGRTGCWETVVGLRALLEASTDSDDPVRDPALTLEDRLGRLVERARLGDGRTLAALEQVGTWLGTGAATLVNTLDPALVVLSGYFAVLGEWLAPAVEAHLAAGVVARDGGGARVVVSTLGPTAAVRGGALVSLESVLSDPTRVTGPVRPQAAPAQNGGTR